MSKNKDIRSGQSGSIFTILMGGIAVVAVLSLAAYQLISGPLASASRITQNNLVKSQLSTIASIAVMDASNMASSGDCDADGYIEPRPWRDPAGAAAPTNGGLLPHEMGTKTTDPWGTGYGYCAWDVGASDCGSTERLTGATDPTTGDPETRSVLAIISAGADRIFQTTCNNYVDATTDLITATGDDIIKRFTYVEAASATSSLWTLSADSTTAEIDKDLNIGNDITFDTTAGSIQALAANATGILTAESGFGIGDETTAADASCTASTNGLIRYNTTLDEAEVCLNSGVWGPIGGDLIWPLDAPDGSAAAPSYSFENFTDAGIFHEADSMVLATGADKTTFAPDSGTEFRLISDGGVQLDTSTGICDLGADGTLQYLPFLKHFIFCDSLFWSKMNGNVDHLLSGSCGIKNDFSHWCWGLNDYGQVGDGTTDNRLVPVEVLDNDYWFAISRNSETACGIKMDGTAWCWGRNDYGQIGDGTTNWDSNPTPVEVSGGDTWKAISAADTHNCGIKTDNTAWCWGHNGAGRLGDGTTTDSPTPVEVSGGDTWKTITANSSNVCGIKTDNTAWCWGRNDYSAILGNGTADDSSIPVEVYGGSTWKAIDIGNTQGCGIKADDTAWCWGYNVFGQLGDGTTNTSDIPVPVSGDAKWKAITSPSTHSCGIKTDDTVWCWGPNSSGQLGDGTTDNSSVPVAVSGGGTWKAITGGSGYVCGIKTDGSVWCWGRNNYGQLGNDSTTNSSVPVPVSGWVMTGSMVERGTVSAASLSGAYDVAVAGNYAYVTGFIGDSMTVVNISDPANPTISGSVSGGGLNGSLSIELAGNYVYVASAFGDRLVIIDISDPANPTISGQVADSRLDFASGVAVAGNYAYVASRYADSLTVVNISDPANPTISGSVSDSGLNGANDVAFSGNFAYVASRYADSLTVVNISDPTDPTISGSVSASVMNDANGVEVKGNYAYVASRSGDSLTVVNIGDPTNPTISGSVSDSGLNGARGVALSGNIAYVASIHADSLTSVNISDPTNPTIIETFSSANIDGAFGVALLNNFAYVASDGASDALTIIEIK